MTGLGEAGEGGYGILELERISTWSIPIPAKAWLELESEGR